MRLSISSEQKDFFQTQNFIIFENFLSPDTAKLLHYELRAAYTNRSDKDIFLSGRDLSRSNTIVRKQVISTQWGKVAADLMEKKALRLALDQLISVSPTDRPAIATQKVRLSEMSCVQGIVGGILICLNKKETSDTHKEFIPKKAGDALFFKANFPLPFDLIYQDGQALYLLIAYGEPSSVYILNENDPSTHYLKRLGYVFGDRLNEKLHPTVYSTTLF